MNKKKFVCFALTGLLALSAAMFTACGDDSGTPTPPPDNGDNPVTPTPTGGPVYAKDWIQSLYVVGSANVRTEEGTGMNSTHDPIVVEAKRNGVSEYYAFSTDNDQFGVQIRKSTNLYTWERAGVAVKGYTDSMNSDAVRNMYLGNKGELQEVYKKVSSYSDWNSKGPCWTLWAPDVVPATSNTGADADGEWWLYSCWTAGFGSSQSVIFKLKSENGITGPYEYEAIIAENASSINEIDPSIYYTPNGEMYMSYGSYSSGFATIQLDAQTGLRKNGATTERGTWILNGSGFNAEGSVISYHTVDVYTGDIANEDYDEEAWTQQSKYYMMGSWGALAYNYNMRVWTSDTPDGIFTSERGISGLQVSASWTWRKQGEGVADGTVGIYDNKSKDTNFYIPGHNDMLTTTDGVNVIAYHTRVSESTKDSNPSFAEGEHYLYTSMYDFNSKGQLVINPNRYVGEKIGKVTAEDLLDKTDGLYSAILMQSRNNTRYEEKATIYHPVDCVLNEDGTITLDGTAAGNWKVYGDHYIWLNINGENYYGTVMPAQIRQYDEVEGFFAHNGLTISAISTDNTTGSGGENKMLYMNMQFEFD